MKYPSKISLASFERISRGQGHGILLVGSILLALWIGGHGALYRAYRSGGAQSHAVSTDARHRTM